MSVKNQTNQRPSYRGGSGVSGGEQSIDGLLARADGVEQLKQRLLQDRLSAVGDPEMHRWLELAADESAALAWTTPYPLLVLPELIEERARVAQTRLEGQRNIRERGGISRTLAA